MDRRAFIAAGMAAAAAGPAGVAEPLSADARAAGSEADMGDLPQDRAPTLQEIRAQFPRLREEVFLNAAGGTPLARFAEAGLRRHEDFWRMGPGEGRGAAFSEMLNGIRGSFGRMVGAQEDEIGLVHCTKAGEQIVLDGLPALRAGGNIVTNDLHFSGSLHNLEGLRRSGVDVRVVRHSGWDVAAEAMEAAMDDRTALVTVTWVSNVNGRVAPLRTLADAAHERGAHLFADIIQGAGSVPLDLSSSGVDFAACSGYKWLFGPHGCGFFYARRELQGTALTDRLFPGHSRPNYTPWVDAADPDEGAYSFDAPSDARRYQPGHVSYLGYSALTESLRFLSSVGVDRCLEHSAALVRRLVDRVDPEKYERLTPDPGASPIVTFRTADAPRLVDPLTAERLVVSLGLDQVRVSPAIYNEPAEVDLLAEVLNRS